jgi:hypothetical protein
VPAHVSWIQTDPDGTGPCVLYSPTNGSLLDIQTGSTVVLQHLIAGTPVGQGAPGQNDVALIQVRGGAKLVVMNVNVVGPTGIANAAITGVKLESGTKSYFKSGSSCLLLSPVTLRQDF